MINLIFISGFLGAGKTTLLKRITNGNPDHCATASKFGLIINELGEIGVDATSLSSDGLIINEINGGSLFAPALKQKFIETLVLMSSTDIEYLFIESSAFTNPSSLNNLLNNCKKRFARPYVYKGSISVIDATNPSFFALHTAFPALKQQIICCDVAIINKTDIASSENINQIINEISHINNKARIILSQNCDIDIENTVKHLSPSKNQIVNSSLENCGFPKVLTLKSQESLSFDCLKSFFKEISPFVFRAKGFALTDKGVVLIDLTQTSTSFTPLQGVFANNYITLVLAAGLKSGAPIDFTKTVGAIEKALGIYFENKLFLGE